jgi:hypothetical protein
MKYQTTNASEPRMIAKLKNTGIPVCLVTKASKKPAVIKIGIRLTIIFNPSFELIINDCRREYVPGKSMLLPSTNPAAPEIIMAEISRVP